MKGHSLYLASLALVLASCETGPITSGGDFDPLTPPGSGRSPELARSGYRPGSFVRTAMDNAAFFNKRPKGDADADRLLAANTEMKVIADDGSYVKVELNSGEVGFVPSVLVSDQSAAAQPAGVASDAIQVYPPLPGGAAVDPAAPTIPPMIDPDAPQLPDAPPIPDEQIQLPPAEPTPLPPGNEAEGLPPVEGGNP